MKVWLTSRTSFLSMIASNVSATWLTFVAGLVDRLPSAVQYGIGRTIRNRLLTVPVSGLSDSSKSKSAAPNYAEKIPVQEMHAVLVTGALGTGGVEAIVATLARRLPAFGVTTSVLCRASGVIADGLRHDGIHVVEAPDLHTASRYLQALPSGTVAQLHAAPTYLIEACTALSFPFIPVIHNTDINMTADDWSQEAHLVEPAPVVIAVSAIVRDFYVRHLPRPPTSSVVVIPNGVDLAPFTAQEITAERTRLSALIGANLDRATVFCCLARYELQKNLPGMVTSFLAASKDREDLHLVVAGPIVDWLEFRLADALRRTAPAGQRIHLLANSSARAILAASDACLLDSFFEGWPVAATEAVSAGLPLVISDVGGAIELVGTESQRGQLFANPASPPDVIDRYRIRRARRQVWRQDNQDAMKRAVLAVADSINEWRERRTSLTEEARSWLSSSTMVRTHADLLKKVASGENIVDSRMNFL